MSNADSYAHLELWKQRFCEATVPEDIPFILVGAKADRSSKVAQEAVEEEWIEAGRAHKHFILSAKEPSTVHHAFQAIGRLTFDSCAKKEMERK